MADKTKKQYIRVSIVGYIPAANILNKDSIQKQFKRLNTIENFAKEQMEDVEYKAKQVGRLVYTTDSVAEPKNKTDDALLETKTHQEPLDPPVSSTDNADDENKKSATEENP